MTLTSEQISEATGSPAANVSENWPLIVAALQASGIHSDLVEVAAAATVAVETGTFAPVVERLANADRQPELFKIQSRYWPWCGRGFVQITWERNYRAYSALCKVDLISNPERAADPGVAANILAAFFKENHVDDAANRQDWRAVRKLVNGGYNGWEPFNRYVCRMLEALHV